MLIKEIFETNSKDISFTTPVGVISLSADKCRFSYLLKKYKAIVKDASEKFVSYCKEEPQNEKDVDDIQEAFSSCLEEIYTEMKKDIASMGSYGIDSDMILECLPNDTFWRYSAIMDILYGAARCNPENIQEYSAVLRNFSSQETFRKKVGVDTEKYIMDVGIVSALHSVFQDTERSFVIGLLIFIEKLNDSQNFDSEIALHNIINRLFGEEEERKNCNRLLSNIKQDVIPKEQAGEFLRQIAQINPFNSEIYTCIVRYFGDENEEVQSLADYLEYGEIVTSYKEELIQNYYEELSMETEGEALDGKEKLETYCVYMGYNGEDKEELLQEITDRLEELDRIYRTVDGVVCETREGADHAREELSDIKEFMSHISAPTSDSLLDYEWMVKEKLTEFDIKFSSELKQKYVKVLEKYLKDFDDSFCTLGLFKKLDRKAAGQERLLRLIKKCDVSTPDKIAEAYIQMEELLPKVGLEKGENEAAENHLEKCKDDLALKFVKENLGTTEEDAKEAKVKLLSYCESLNLFVNEKLRCIQYIDKVLSDFDLKYRTVDQIVCDTRESADFARSELDGIREFMGRIAEPTDESLLDYESDLLEKRKIFDETFQSELKQKYLTQIDKYLSDFDKKFCSMGFFKKGDRKQAGRDKALKYVKRLDCSSPDKVAEAYRLLEEFLPKVGITLAEASEAVQYLEKKKSGKGLFGSVGKLFGK